MRCDGCVMCDVHLPIIPIYISFFSKQINGTFSSHASLVSPRNRMHIYPVEYGSLILGFGQEQVTV